MLRAVDGVSFTIDRGEVLGLVGESGCGKSVTSLSIMRLVPPPGRIAAGRVLFEGEDLLAKDAEAMRRVRGARIAMVFQEPMTSLNPVFSIGDQIASAVLAHGGGGRHEAWERTHTMLDLVQIPSPRQRARDYPHQLSGGLRQRAMIAMALASGPALLIADEPTTALDVTIQAQILDLLRRLQAERGMAVLLITHDLGVVAELCHRVAVIYGGRIVELAPVRLSSRGRFIPIRGASSSACRTRAASGSRSSPSRACHRTSASPAPAAASPRAAPTPSRAAAATSPGSWSGSPDTSWPARWWHDGRPAARGRGPRQAVRRGRRVDRAAPSRDLAPSTA